MLQRRPAAVPTSPDPASCERRRHLLSDAFVDRLTAHLERAAERAVQVHHDAGLPVHGAVDGQLAEVQPSDPKP